MRNGVFVGMYPIKDAIIGGVIGFIITQIAFKINKNRYFEQFKEFVEMMQEVEV